MVTSVNVHYPPIMLDVNQKQASDYLHSVIMCVLLPWKCLNEM